MYKKLVLLFVISICLMSLANSSFAGVVNLPNPLGSTGDFPTLINRVVNYIAGFVASLATIVIIWAGILFLTSGGSEQQLSRAKRALLYAAIGLAIAIAGSGLINLVTYIITG